jgi:hypothetical protein
MPMLEPALSCATCEPSLRLFANGTGCETVANQQIVMKAERHVLAQAPSLCLFAEITCGGLIRARSASHSIAAPGTRFHVPGRQ